jgi:hypothetical protein
MHYLGTILVPISFFEDQLFSIDEEAPTLLKKERKKSIATATYHYSNTTNTKCESVTTNKIIKRKG